MAQVLIRIRDTEIELRVSTRTLPAMQQEFGITDWDQFSELFMKLGSKPPVDLYRVLLVLIRQEMPDLTLEELLELVDETSPVELAAAITTAYLDSAFAGKADEKKKMVRILGGYKLPESTSPTT